MPFYKPNQQRLETKHCICKLTHSILGKHKLHCGKGQTRVSAAASWAYASFTTAPFTIAEAY